MTPIAFVIPRSGEKTADAGFAARGWIVETFKWINENAPQKHHKRLMGLLLGYSVDAIALNDEIKVGAKFPNTVEEFESLPLYSKWLDESKCVDRD